MLPIILAAGAFGAVTLQRSQNTTSDVESEEQIETFFLGRRRDKNLFPGKTITAENSRIIRPDVKGVLHPETAAREWDEYHRRHEDVAKTLSSGYYAGGDNARYQRSDINKKRRRPHLPDEESFKDWKAVPTVYFEHTGHPGKDGYPDMDYTSFEDQTGDAITVPGAPHYIITNNEHKGNPWGPSGQFFNAGGMRARSADERISTEKIPAKIKKDTRVRFYGLPQ